MPDSPICTAPTTWEPLAYPVCRPKVEVPQVDRFKVSLQEEMFPENHTVDSLWGKDVYEHSGSDRQNHRCLECSYRLAEFGRTRYWSDGIAAAPSSVALFWTSLDRYFLGVSDHLGCKIPPESESLCLDPSWEERPLRFRMWMVRCPMCTRWKELRDFRLERPYVMDSRFEYELLSEGRCCNSCFADTHGRLELGRALGTWFRALVDKRLRHISSVLKYHACWFDLRAAHSKKEMFESKLSEIKLSVSCFKPEHDSSILSHQDISELKYYRAQAIRMLERADRVDGRPIKAFRNTKPVVWGPGPEACVATMKRLDMCKKLSEENQEAWAAWALDRDESSWDREVEGALSRTFKPDMKYHRDEFLS